MPRSKNRRKNGKTAHQIKTQQPSQRRRFTLGLRKVAQDDSRICQVTISVPFVESQILKLAAEWHVTRGECVDNPFLLSGAYGDFVIRSLLHSPIMEMQRLFVDPEQKNEVQLKIDPAFPIGVLYKVREALCYHFPGAKIL